MDTWGTPIAWVGAITGLLSALGVVAVWRKAGSDSAKARDDIETAASARWEAFGTKTEGRLALLQTQYDALSVATHRQADEFQTCKTSLSNALERLARLEGVASERERAAARAADTAIASAVVTAEHAAEESAAAEARPAAAGSVAEHDAHPVVVAAPGEDAK